MTIQRYENLLRQSTDPGNPPGTQERYRAEADKLRAADPQVEQWVRFKASQTGQAKQEPPKARARPKLPPVVTDLLRVAQAAALEQAPRVVQTMVTAAADSAIHRMTAPRPNPSPRASSMTNRTSNLLRNFDIAGRIFADTEGDTFVLTLTLTAGDAEDLVTAYGDGAKKLPPRVGEALLDALTDLMQSDGEIGEWPFSEEED